MAGRGLLELPPEITTQIISNAPDAKFLRNLSLTCRALHSVVETNGWSTFVTKKFPSFDVPPFWKNAAHALTTLSNNFDGGNWVGQGKNPDPRSWSMPVHDLSPSDVPTRRNRQAGQTMGYRPVIDSFEKFTGNTWDSRKEIVAWGAGPTINCKITERGDLEGYGKSDRSKYDTGCGSRRCFLTYTEAGRADGWDDITSLNLLDHKEDDEDNAVRMVVGRASGGLQELVLSVDGVSNLRSLDTHNMPVKSADIHSPNPQYLGAILGDSRLALYSLQGDETSEHPVSEIDCVSKEEKSSRCWTSKFLSPTRVAVGRGKSQQIVNVYEVREDGLSKEPIKTFRCTSDSQKYTTSAYPLVKVPHSSSLTEGPGNEFFSGGYDGLIRLHDMRSRNTCEFYLQDRMEISAIFSLCTVGRERVIAGSSNHNLLKIFDLRMPGGRLYASSNGDIPDEGVLHPDNFPYSHSEKQTQSGWNVYMSRSKNRGRTYNARSSPVYSLSRPSSSSPLLYIGVEDAVLDFNFTSSTDPYPDPLFQRSLVYRRNGSLNFSATWGNPHYKGYRRYRHDLRENFSIIAMED